MDITTISEFEGGETIILQIEPSIWHNTGIIKYDKKNIQAECA